MSCFCTGGRRDSVSSSSAAIPSEHRRTLRRQDTGRRAKVKDSVGQLSVEKQKSQLLSGTFCKQQKFKTGVSCPKLSLPNAYLQWDSTAEGNRSQFSFFSWIFFLCNLSCPAFFVVQHTLLMLRVLHGRSRMAEHFTKKYSPAILTSAACQASPSVQLLHGKVFLFPKKREGKWRTSWTKDFCVTCRWETSFIHSEIACLSCVWRSPLWQNNIWDSLKILIETALILIS